MKTTREEFIEKMEAKGFKLNIYDGTNGTYLSRGGMETFQIYDDNSVGYSSPRGCSRFNSFDDYFEGRTSDYEEYSLRD